MKEREFVMPRWIAVMFLLITLGELAGLILIFSMDEFPLVIVVPGLLVAVFLIAMAAHQVARPNRLSLSAHGLVQKVWFSKPLCLEWRDIESFFIFDAGYRTTIWMVGFQYVDERKSLAAAGQTRTVKTPDGQTRKLDGMVAKPWSLNALKLARLLDTYLQGRDVLPTPQ